MTVRRSTGKPTWMRKTYVRCSKCERRFTFSRPPDKYDRPRRCSCGSRSFYKDRWMHRRNTSPYGGMGCLCGAMYHFIHRKGSLGCIHHPKIDETMKERAEA